MISRCQLGCGGGGRRNLKNKTVDHPYGFVPSVGTYDKRWILAREKS